MIFYKIIERNKPGSKDGEKLYYAKTIITGKTDFNELCDKVNKLSKIDKRVVSEVLTYAWQTMKIDMAHGKAIENVDKTCCYIQITSKAKKNKDDVSIKDYSKREIIIKPGPTVLEFFDKFKFYEKRS
jgi:hypothetical protein